MLSPSTWRCFIPVHYGRGLHRSSSAVRSVFVCSSVVTHLVLLVGQAHGRGNATGASLCYHKKVWGGVASADLVLMIVQKAWALADVCIVSWSEGTCVAGHARGKASSVCV